MESLYHRLKDGEKVPPNFTGVVMYPAGDKVWYLNGERHRIGNPAMITRTNTRFWFERDRYHRIDGAAVEWNDGGKWFYLDGIRFTEEDYWNDPRTGI